MAYNNIPACYTGRCHLTSIFLRLGKNILAFQQHWGNETDERKKQASL